MVKEQGRRRTKRQRQILDAALRCFQEKGFHGTSMSAICKRAGMSPGHLYHYYSSKVELIEAIAEEDCKTAERNIAELTSNEDPVKSLFKEMEGVWKHGQGMHGAINAEVLAEAAHNSRVSEIIRRRNNRIRGILAETLESAKRSGKVHGDLDPVGTASVLIALADGLSAAYDAHTGIDIERASEATRKFLERSLRPVRQGEG